MYSIRFLVVLVLSVFCFSLIFYHGSLRWSNSNMIQKDLGENGGVGTLFNWRTPSSLFPPSAIISLTDDNSTFFLARPAAFGPFLPSKSMSGQLWIGNGFGDESHSARNGAAGGVMEGELGCSDVPGWSDAELHKILAETRRLAHASTEEAKSHDELEKQKRDRKKELSSSDAKAEKSSDGTDNHLLSIKNAWRGKTQSNTKKAHADIQSLQESAEIAGKVVLLTRGGCGFLDKVKWAQRRGAVAVIIGDDIRGGPLVTMYARGDTSNISIPALFTSHTTAHLLSSLMPTGRGNKNIITPDESTRLGVGLGEIRNGKKSGKSQAEKSKTLKNDEAADDTNSPRSKRSTEVPQEGSGWFWSMFGTEGLHGKPAAHLPPNDGTSDWVMQTEFDAEEGRPAGSKKSNKKQKSKQKTVAAAKPDADSFVIGVHDWRDPALLASQKEKQAKRAAVESLKKAESKSKRDGAGSSDRASNAAATKQKDADSTKKAQSWLDRIIHGKQDEILSPAEIANAKSRIIDSAQPVSNPVHLHDIHIPGAMFDEPTEHEGLWVTLSPTSMSSSPFFDTLLVLVVSPLVTLTVVYALLILRSRMRRRRWRAPKSVVERLPVRTYQTMVSSPTSSTTSSISTDATAQTPLLSSSPRPIRSRPRSRTDTEVPTQASSASQSLDQVEEKKEAGLAEWRRKYGGKQKECVVCLDEYVDGVSRVMSLPCGHEFHEGCITPWLTTRRRTCPICKGDVVRSLARSHGSTSTAHQVIEEETDEDVQEQAAVLTNDSPSSQLPISRDDEAFEDLERGVIEHPDRDR